MQENPTRGGRLEDMIRHALKARTIRGAEGEGQDPSSGGAGGSGAAGEVEGSKGPVVPDPLTAPLPTAESFPRSYVEELRAEAAKHRTEARDAKAKIAEFEAANLSEIEKLRLENQRLQEERTAFRNETLARARRDRVTEIAKGLKFNDPLDALGFIPADISTDDEGLPTVKAIQGALGKVVQEKPYLVTPPPPGSGDGAASGSPVGGSFDQERATKYQEQFNQRGGVKVG